MSTALWHRSLVETRDAIARGDISPVEIVNAVLARITERAGINAYITVLAERAHEEAREREATVRRGDALGPLHGIPIALKDNIATAGVTTTAGTPVRADWVPGEDADVAARLKAAGAIIIGKNNLFEIAFGAAHPRFGETLNPWDSSLTCGGSSSGSAAAVADGQAFGAVGTDTGGSIRIPAAMCGIVGLKPTRGALSNRGVVPVSPDLDVVGPMARDAADASLLYQGMGGIVADNERAASALTVGVPRDLEREPVEPAIAAALDAALDRLRQAGVTLRPVDLPDLSLSLDVMWTIASADVAEFYRAELTRSADTFCSEVRRNLIGGALIPATDYIRARRLQDALRRQTGEAFAGTDAVLLPSCPIGPYRSGAQRLTVGGVEHKVLPVIMRFTPLANVTGQPAVVVPVLRAGAGPPTTVQLYGPAGGEGPLLRLAGLIGPPEPILPPA